MMQRKGIHIDHRPRCRRWSRALGFLFLGLVFASQATAQAPKKPADLKAIPFYGKDKKIQLTWKAGSDDQTGFEVRRKIDAGGTYQLVTTTAADTVSYDDTDVDDTKEYFYVLRAINKAGNSGDTEEVQQNLKILWPVLSKDGKVNREILHTWNEPIGNAGVDHEGSPTGFHSGVDIQRNGRSNQVVAPRGGVIDYLQEFTSNGDWLGVKVQVDGAPVRDKFGHLETIAVKSGDVVHAGQTLGYICERCYKPDWLDHTHFYIVRPKSGSSTGQHPLSIYSALADRDPMDKAPALTKHTGSPGIWRFRKHGTTDYFSTPIVLTGDVDIIAEIADQQGTDPDQVPTRIEYWVESPARVQGCATFHGVKKSTGPYVLYDWSNTYFGYEDNPTDLAKMINDYSVNYGKSLVVGKEAYIWENYKHFIITNTKGITGAAAQVDSGQFWNTNAKDDKAPDDTSYANYAGKKDTVKPGEARFPDGLYLIRVLASDLVHRAAPLAIDTVRIENFPPTVCACAPSAPVASGMQSVDGSITFSEKMDATIAASTIVAIDNGATLANARWRGDQRQILFTIQNLADGKSYTITVSGANAKDAPPSPGGKKLDGNGDGVGGDDFTCTFEVSKPVPIDVQDLEAATLFGGGVELSWKLSHDALTRLAGIRVERAETAEGPWTVRTSKVLGAAPEMSFVDSDVELGRSYWYRLLLESRSGAAGYGAPIQAGAAAVRRTELQAAVDRGRGAAVEIRYAIERGGTPVRLEVFDVSGRRVRQLANGSHAAGEFVRRWDRRNENGAIVARGLYIVQLTAGSRQFNRKLVLIHD